MSRLLALNRIQWSTKARGGIHIRGCHTQPSCFLQIPPPSVPRVSPRESRRKRILRWSNPKGSMFCLDIAPGTSIKRTGSSSTGVRFRQLCERDTPRPRNTSVVEECLASGTPATTCEKHDILLLEANVICVIWVVLPLFLYQYLIE